MWWFGSFKFNEKDIEGLGQRSLTSLAILHIVIIALMLLTIWGLIAWMGVGFWDFVWGVFVWLSILSWLSD